MAADTFIFDDSLLPPNHHSGFVTVVGRPNAGKSTLINYYLGQKIAIVSPKPQTTRNRMLGILTLNRAQIIFVDTPGIHKPHHKFGEYLVEEAVRALPDSDIILWLADASEAPTDEDNLVAEAIQAQKDRPPVILALNKIDLLSREDLLFRLAQFTDLFQPDQTIPLSALRGDNRDELLNLIIETLPPGPRYFPADQVTDQHLRFIAAELIREAALQTLRQEVPHALALLVEEFKERSQNLVYISAKLFVERESQKGIVIGKGGLTLKKIGQLARPQIEDLVDAKIFLELRVKVRPKWRKKKEELKRLGYSVGE